MIKEKENEIEKNLLSKNCEDEKKVRKVGVFERVETTVDQERRCLHETNDLIKVMGNKIKSWKSRLEEL